MHVSKSMQQNKKLFLVAKAYLIGGVPRCGKTSIALRVLKDKAMFATSTDSVRFSLRSLASADEQPALFNASEKFSEDHIRELCLSGRASEIIEAQNEESRAVWPTVQTIIQGYLQEDLDILVEGVAVLPEFVASLDWDRNVVFVGNTAPVHGEHMLAHARSGKYDWISDRSDDSIIAFAKFTNEFSNFLAEEALQYNMPFFDYATRDFDEHMQAATEKLLR